MTWLLALTPFLVAPPLVALAVAWNEQKKGQSQARFDGTWVMLVALINIALSIVLLARYHAQAVELIRWLEQAVSYWRWHGPSRPASGSGIQSI